MPEESLSRVINLDLDPTTLLDFSMNYGDNSGTASFSVIE